MSARQSCRFVAVASIASAEVAVAGATAGPYVGPGAKVAVNVSVGISTIKLQRGP
jgi:hypothetical protein